MQQEIVSNDKFLQVEDTLCLENVSITLLHTIIFYEHDILLHNTHAEIEDSGE